MMKPVTDRMLADRMREIGTTRRLALVLAFILALLVMAGSQGNAHAGTWKCDYRDSGVGPYTWGIKGAHQMVGEVENGRAAWLSLPSSMTVKYKVDFPGKDLTLPMTDDWTLDYSKIKKSGSKYLFDFGYKFAISDPIDKVLSKVLALANKIPGGSKLGAVKYAGKFKTVVGVAKTILEKTQTVDFHMWASNSSAGVIKYDGGVAFRCL